MEAYMSDCFDHAGETPATPLLKTVTCRVTCALTSQPTGFAQAAESGIRRFTKAAGTVTRPEPKGRATVDKLIIRTIRRENNVLENICKHGVGHPAFGSADYWWLRRDKEADPDATDDDNPLLIHGCCGCCHSKEWQLEDLLAGVKAGNRILLRTQRALLATNEALGIRPRDWLMEGLALQSMKSEDMIPIKIPKG